VPAVRFRPQESGTAPVFLIVGLALGLIVGFYELAKTMWRK
jgi:F0F1-type ATP synthase assembly protein I